MTSIIIYSAIEKLTGIDPKKRMILYLMSGFMIFSFSQQVNFLWGFQMQIFMTVLFNLLSITILAYSDGIYTYLALIPAVLATYSFGNGMLVWPVGFFMIWIRGHVLKKKADYLRLFIWLLSSVIFIGLYFYKFDSGTLRAPFLEKIKFFITRPHVPVILFASYLGAPLASYRQSIALSAGLTGLGFQIYSLVKIIRRNNWDINKLFWLAVDLYVILSAGVTVYGRSGTISSTMALQYLSISMLFWIVTPCIFFISLEDEGSVKFRYYILFALVVVSLSVSEDALIRARENSEGLNIFKKQMISGEYDENIFIRYVNPERSSALYIPLMKKYGIKNFSNAPDVDFSNDFRPVTVELEEFDHHNSCGIDEIKYFNGKFITLSGWWNIDSFGHDDKRKSDTFMIIYNSDSAYEAALSEAPEKLRLTGTKYPDPLEIYNRHYFTGNQLYSGSIRPGKYNLALKVISLNRIIYLSTEEIITLD